MVNFLTVGISALSMLADNPQINLPVMAHMNFAGGLYGAPQSGVSSHLLLGKLPRLAGADVVVYPSAYGKFAMQAAKSQRIGQALLSPFYNLKPVWPMPGGGIHPGLLPKLYHELGINFRRRRRWSHLRSSARSYTWCNGVPTGDRRDHRRAAAAPGSRISPGAQSCT